MRVIITKAAYDSLPQRLKDQLPAAPTEGATMKDSHGQTAKRMLDNATKAHERVSEWPQQLREATRQSMDMRSLATKYEAAPIVVQDYREYTADEILHEIVKFTEQAGWGDPANLGHWLGAAQRWALKERV